MGHNYKVRNLFHLFLYLGVGDRLEKLKLVGYVLQDAENLPIAGLSALRRVRASG